MAGSGWRITSQLTDQVINTRGGAVITGTYVYFVTGEGNDGVVFIPDNKYATKYVREQVRAAAILLDEVGALAENMP